jgi:hypothetical protein
VLEWQAVPHSALSCGGAWESAAFKHIISQTQTQTKETYVLQAPQVSAKGKVYIADYGCGCGVNCKYAASPCHWSQVFFLMLHINLLRRYALDMNDICSSHGRLI